VVTDLVCFRISIWKETLCYINLQLIVTYLVQHHLAMTLNFILVLLTVSMFFFYKINDTTIRKMSIRCIYTYSSHILEIESLIENSIMATINIYIIWVSDIVFMLAKVQWTFKYICIVMKSIGYRRTTATATAAVVVYILKRYTYGMM